MYTLRSSPYGWIPNENYSKMYNCTSKFVTKYIGFHNSRFENEGYKYKWNGVFFRILKAVIINMYVCNNKAYNL